MIGSRERWSMPEIPAPRRRVSWKVAGWVIAFIVVPYIVSVFANVTTDPISDHAGAPWGSIAAFVGAQVVRDIVPIVTGVIVVVLLYLWSQGTPDTEVERENLVKRLGEAEAKIEALAKERRALKEKADELQLRYSDAHREASAAIQARDLAKVHVKERAARVAELEPLAEWASELIEKERDRQPIEIDRRYIWIHEPETLRANEPKFQLRIGFEYFGVHRLIVGEKCNGALSRYQREEYNHEVKVTFDHDKDNSAFVRVGYTRATLCLTQKVSRESADELLAIMSKNVPEGLLTVGTKGVFVSVRVVARHHDEELYSGRFPLSEDIEARYSWGDDG